MGDSLESWRAAIGQFSSSGMRSKQKLADYGSFHLLFNMLLVISVLSTLLLIGGIEQNPGPFPCRLCSAVPETIASSIRHQNFHARNMTYVYYCPSEGCLFRTCSYGSLNFHVSQYHRSTRHVDPASSENIVCIYNTIDGHHCEFLTLSFWELVQHLCKHLDEGISVQCPVKDCTFSKAFAKKSVLRSHLSLYHKSWRDEGCPKEQYNVSCVPASPAAAVPLDSDCVFNLNDNIEASESDENSDLLNDELILNSIAKFYLHLYAQSLLPQETIQEICDSLVFLTEVVHSRMKLVLSKELNLLGMPEDKINLLCLKLLYADLLFTSHHKNSPGPSFSTDYLRKEYFKKNFGFLEPTQINLDENDPSSKRTLQYVPIPQTLSKQLEDPSVQQEIDISFDQQSNETDEVSNYTDGTLFKSEDHPRREIQLLLYQDTLNPVMNALGSAKNKFKCLVVYYTIGNLRPHIRSKVDTKQFVMMCRESVFKEVGAKKCLKELMSELRVLESEGILYRGEKVDVAVEFMLGDSLGQHLIGGYIECFSSTYMCRFCPMTRSYFKANPSVTKPQRSEEDYNRCVLRAKLLGKSSKGIKADCELNTLKYFHATSHLPVCPAHDLWEGAVSWDLSGIIARFVEKKWFSYKLLNRRIRNFKCKGIDSPNKPALVSIKGDKLGGHAVQNWMMLRLLPFLIGDKIQDFEDPGWKLYLQLKELCEFLCGPSFLKSDMPYLKDVLIPAYFQRRETVLDPDVYPLKPKHHYKAHYPELMLKYGPLLHLWTMPFEQKHKFFKELLRKTKNFINPERSCAVREQMHFCYITSSTLFSEEIAEKKSKALSSQSYQGELAFFIENLNWQNVFECESVYFNGIRYKKCDVILLSSNGTLISLGVIKVIALKEYVLSLVIERRSATYDPQTGIYEIDLDSLGTYGVVSPSALKYPIPQPVYTFKGRSCFSIKHKLI